MSNTIDSFLEEISESGHCLFPSVVSNALLADLRRDIPIRAEACRAIRAANGLDARADGVAHHVVGGSDSLARFMEALPLDDYIKAFFEGEYILNSYGAINNGPSATSSYAHGQRFHRDVRTWSGGFRLMLNMLVMVDDFTLLNGATKLVSGSHRVKERPDDAEMESRSVRLLGSAGDVALFDSNLWHCAAENRTQFPRMALTLTFTRPFFKQQMDYPRFLGERYTDDPRMRQLLGYNSRVPCNHDEWYQPPELRMYKPGQG